MPGFTQVSHLPTRSVYCGILHKTLEAMTQPMIPLIPPPLHYHTHGHHPPLSIAYPVTHTLISVCICMHKPWCSSHSINYVYLQYTSDSSVKCTHDRKKNWADLGFIKNANYEIKGFIYNILLQNIHFLNVLLIVAIMTIDPWLSI